MTIDGVTERLRRGVPYWRGDRGASGATVARRPRRRPLPGPRVVIALVVITVLLGCGWLWLRDSSLVSVDHVTVSGAGGADAARVRTALGLAARNMTTLDVRMDQLRSAVAPFPVVKDLRVTTHFPHGMDITVIEQIPVAVVVVNGHRIAVAGDGTLLHDMRAPPNLATVPLRVPPGGSRVTDHNALGAVEVLAGAPYDLLARVTQVSTTSPHGLVAQLRNGPAVYFGDATRVAAKWTALASVLADPSSAGAVYIDVTDPDRPAAGGVGPAPTAGGPATSGGGSTSTGAGTSSTGAGASSGGGGGGSAGNGSAAGTSGAGSATSASGNGGGSGTAGTSGAASTSGGAVATGASGSSGGTGTSGGAGAGGASGGAGVSGGTRPTGG